MKPLYENLSQKKLAKSRVEISASIPADVFEGYRAQALKNINESVSIDGFRKGKVPENVLVQKVGEKTVLEEMVELAVARAYPAILLDNKIDAIGRPTIRITKLARDNLLEFIAETAVMPQIALPDYKSIAADAGKTFVKENTGNEKVTDAELDAAILRIRKGRVSHEGHDHANPLRQLADGGAEEHEKAIMENLPPLTDDFVKTLGDFADVPDFKTKISTMISEGKKSQAHDKLRVAIADAILEKTSMELPETMIESEVARTEAQFKADIERMGIKLDDYLNHAKKSIEDLRTDWRPAAEKKAKLQLVVNAIAETEKLAPDREAVKAETDHILEHYPDALRENAEIYAETILTNDKVFQFLEKQA